MTTIRAALIVSSLIALRIPAVAAGADENLSGRWKVQVERSGGQSDYYLDLKHEGTAITGTFTSPRSGSYPIASGSFAEGKLRVEVPRTIGTTTRIYLVEAAATAADRLEGKLLIDGQDSGTVVVTRHGVPVLGKWSVLTRSPDGKEYPSTIQLSEEGGTLKGVSVGRTGTIALAGVKFADGKLSYDIDLSVDGAAMRFTVTAELKDPDTLAGRWKARDADLSGDWSATRQVAEGVTAAAPATPPAGTAEMSGTWYGVSTSPGEPPMSFRMDLAVEGAAPRGKVAAEALEFEIREGKVEGARIEFLFRATGRRGEGDVKVEGTLSEGVLRGTWAATDGSTKGEWTARKPTVL